MLRFIALLAVTTVLGGWIYYTFFYTGTRRKPPYTSRHSLAAGRKPIVWIDWEEKYGDRILTFGATL